jgi:hypothetical protein
MTAMGLPIITHDQLQQPFKQLPYKRFHKLILQHVFGSIADYFDHSWLYIMSQEMMLFDGEVLVSVVQMLGCISYTFKRLFCSPLRIAKSPYEYYAVYTGSGNALALEENMAPHWCPSRDYIYFMWCWLLALSLAVAAFTHYSS